MTEAEVSKKKKKTEDNSTEKELSLNELREKLARKELEEKLKERHVDTSLIGVCQTCHIPIYHGEPVYTPHDYASESNWHAEGGGVGSGSGGIGIGAGGVRGGNKKHSVSEGWIQCGWCYKQYHKELGNVKVWNRRLYIWGACVGIPLGIIGFFLGYSKILDLYGWMGRPDAPPLHSAIWIGIGFAIFGYAIGVLIHRIKWSEPVPDRYKLRENPNRKK